MKTLKSIFSRNLGFFSFFLVCLFVIFTIFYPVFFQGKIPISTNLLVSFYNPWAKEMFSGWERGIPNKPTGIDDLQIFIPQRQFTYESFAENEIPFWNPYIFSGNYHVGQSEIAVFYPLFLLFQIIPLSIGWTVLIMIQPLLASLGMFLFLRLLINDIRPAIFGSIIFGFSGLVLVRMVEGISVGHTLIWTPFIFYGIEGFLQKKKIRYLYVMLIALTLSLLAGWFQFAFYAFVLGFFYAIFRLIGSWKDNNYIRWKRWLVLLPFILLPFVSSSHMIPALQAFADSPRGTQSEKVLLDLHLMPFQHLVTYLIPDFWGNPGSYNFFGKSEYKESILYIGFVPLFFAFFSFFWKMDKRIKFFGVATLLSLLLGLDNPVSRIFFSFPIPIIQSFLPNRIFFIATFSLSVLAAFGMYILLLGKIKRKTIVSIFAGFSVFILLINIYVILGLIFNYLEKNDPLGSYLQIKDYQSVLYNAGMVRAERDIIVQARNTTLGNLIFVSLALIFFIKNRIKPKVFFTILMAVTILSQMYFAWKYIPFSEPRFLFPDHPIFSYLRAEAGINRFISVGESSIKPNIPLYNNIYSAYGVGAMYPKNYAQLVRYVESKGKETKNVSRVEVNLVPSSKKLFTNQEPYLLRFMELAGVKYAVKLKEENVRQPERFLTSGTDTFKLVWENSKWQIFEYSNILPRFFWTGDFIVSDDKNKVLNMLFDPGFNPHILILEELPGFLPNKNATGKINLVKYSPNEIIFQSNSKENGLLFLSDNYTSLFKVKVDGKDGSIIKADYTFRAVPLTSGRHTIKMYYDSSYVKYGFFAGGLILLTTCFVTFVLIKKKTLIF